MFHLSIEGLLFLVSVSAKALALFCLAAVTLTLLRLHDVNIRHRVWTGVLTGMLLLPPLAFAVPSFTLAIPWPFEDTSAAVLNDASPAPAVELATRTITPEGTPASQEELALPANPPATVPEPLDSADAVQTPALEASVATEVAVTPPEKTDYLRIGSTVALFGWGFVACLFATRLFVGLWTSQRLIDRAAPCRCERVEAALQSLPEGVVRAGVAIRQSDEVLVPVTVGWLRPVVLLPAEWTTWTQAKLSAILAHELTHVARRDFGVCLAAELNSCVYWFHPVAWWLRSQLSELAETACDDAAIRCTGDPTGYARHLLEVATSLSGRRSRLQPGLAMARESNVAGRITLILDSDRQRSRRLGWPGTTAIAAVAVVAATTTAALHPARAVDASPAADSTSANPSPASEPSADDQTVRIHGRVSSEDGAVSGARVGVYRVRRSQYYAASDEAVLVKELKVDADGNFDDTLRSDQLWNKDEYGFWNVLVASAPNFAHSLLVGNPGTPIVDGKPVVKPDFMKERVELQLLPQVPIRGRVLSIEGQPIAGATVGVYQMLRSEAKRLDEWLKTTASAPPQDAGQMRRQMRLGGPPAAGVLFPHIGYLHLPTSCVPEVQTNSQGEFTLSNLIAENDLAILRIRGPGITDSTLHVLGRQQPTVYGRHITRISRYGAYHGRNFSFIAQPSVPVSGVVRDIETKQPLRNVAVAVGGVYGATMSHTGYLVTNTDEQGRYRIEGLPIPPVGTRQRDGNDLSVRFKGLPYIENDSIPIPIGDGVNPVEFNVEVRRAVMARGRIVDRSTGKPVSAELYYTPFLTNPHNEKYSRYSDGITTFLGNDSRYHTDDNGYFEIPVIPGRGVLTAKCPQGGFITGFGADEIPEYQGEPARNTSDHIVPSMFHSVKLLDVPVDAEEFAVDLEVDPGASLTIRFEGPDGEPLSDVGCRGLGTDRQWKQIKEDHAKVTSLEAGKVRPMYFNHKATKLQRLVRLTPSADQKEFVVRLLPPSELRGRLIDPEGRPLANVTVEARHDNNPDFMNSLQQVQTDQDGRFKYLLPVGTSYTVIGQMEKYFQVVKDLENERPQSIELGDLVVDPDAERWAPAKPKQDPVITDLVAAERVSNPIADAR